jgi:hypothetical protein
MSPFWIGLLIGLVSGGSLGALIMAAVVLAKDADRAAGIKDEGER